MTKAFSNSPDTFGMASDRLKDDKDLILKLMEINLRIVAYMSDRLKDTPEIFIKAAKKRSWTFVYASDRLKDDFETVK